MEYAGVEGFAKSIHDNAVCKGFWTRYEGESQVNQILAKMMLISTEVSELADAYVKQRGDKEIVSEMADITIRLIDLYEAMREYGIVESNLFEVIVQKHQYNMTRPAKHNRLM